MTQMQQNLAKININSTSFKANTVNKFMDISYPCFLMNCPLLELINCSNAKIHLSQYNGGITMLILSHSAEPVNNGRSSKI